MMSLLSLLLSLSLFANAADNCTYQIDEENSMVEGTGYKYTEKTGVTAKFHGVKLSRNEKKKSVKELLTGMKVTVDLMTLDSGSDLRDQNLRETLFAGILGDSVAVVEVKEVTKDKLKTELTLNEKAQPIEFTYSSKDGTLTANGTFDALKFAMGDQIAAVKKRCGSLHTGKDGKSVSWTDFALKVTAKLKKDCKK